MAIDQLLDWIIELQSIVQAGLTYGKDIYDRERYQRLREIAAEMMAQKSGFSLERVTGLFCNDSIFKILLVHENDGSWSLPGGWVEVNLSLKENTLKEIKAETGLDASVERIIAIHDRNKHNPLKYAYGVCKVFVLCQARGGSFSKKY